MCMIDLEKIARFAQTFSLHQVDEEVLEKAKLLILDSLTAIVLGNQNEEIKRLMELVTESEQIESGQFPVLGRNEQLNFRTAALINGIGLVADELDEGNPFAKG